MALLVRTLLALLATLTACVAMAAAPTDGKRQLVVGRPATVTSEHKTALVVGNSAYRSSPLANPVNDARAIAVALKSLGFRVVLSENASRKGLREAIRDFGDALGRDGVGLFYYAGHGMQVKGRNFLIPVDADIRREDEIADEGVDVQLVLDKMDTAKGGVNLVILDACRDNPFARSFRSASRGLAPVDAPSGTLVAFATAPGQTASDGAGKNGLYTQHLLAALNEPGLKVEDVFKRVRVGVKAASNGAQVPWENTSLEGDFYFRPPPRTATAATAASIVAPVAAASGAGSPPTPPAAAPAAVAALSEAQLARKLKKLASGNRTGFVDAATGEWVIAAKFTAAEEFPDGLAYTAVQAENGKWGLIDKAGNERIAPTYDAVNAHLPGKTGLVLVKAGNRLGLVDGSGAARLEPRYDDIRYEGNERRGYFVLRLGGLHGLAERSGKPMMEPVYEAVEFLPGLDYHYQPPRLPAVIGKARLGGRWGYIGADGRLLGEANWDELTTWFSDEGHAKAKRNGLWGLADARGRTVLEARFEDIGNINFHWERGAVKSNGKWGTIDRQGEFIVTPRFDEAVYLSHGFSAAKHNGRFGLADASGRWVVEPRFEEIRDYYLRDFDAVYAKSAGLWGVLDIHGEWLIAPRFEEIASFDAKNRLAPAKREGKWGLIDITGEWVLTPRYDKIDTPQGDHAAAQLGGRWGLIDLKGEWLVKPEYDYLSGFFANGLALAQRGGKYCLIKRANLSASACTLDYLTIGTRSKNPALLPARQEGRWGYIDPTGRFLIAPQFQQARDFDAGGRFAEVQVDGKWGLIDAAGRQVLKPDYDGIWNIGELWSVKREGVWGLIDATGKFLIAPKYDAAIFPNPDSGLAAVRENGRTGILDRQGTWVWAPQAGLLAAAYNSPYAVFSDRSKTQFWFADAKGTPVDERRYDIPAWGFDKTTGLACARLKGNWGCIDRQLKTVIDFRFDGIGQFDEASGLAFAREGRRWGWIDATGRWVRTL